MPSATLHRLPPDEDRYDACLPSLLWSPAVVARWAGAGGAAALVVVGSWFAIGGQASWKDQRPWMSLALVGLVVAAFVSLNLLIAGRRAIGLRRVALLGDLPEPLSADAVPVAVGAPSAVPASAVLVAGEGLVRYHRADCPLTVGRGYAEAALVEHASAGRQPCGVCLR